MIIESANGSEPPRKHGEKSMTSQLRKTSTKLKTGLHSTSAQAYTEYVVILAALMAMGSVVGSVFIGFEAIQDIFYGYYASLANYLNLPFF